MTAFTSFDAIPEASYGVIMADPPWLFANWSKKGEAKNPVAHYRCMPVEDIRDLPVHRLAGRDCVLWLWATNPMLPQALEVMDAWGFAFKTAGHWAKLTRNGKQAFGTGYILRSAGEPYLIGTIGNPKGARNVRSVIMARMREHSRKPDKAYRDAEKLNLATTRRLDLFGREEREGWDVFGDEIGKHTSSD